MAIKVRAHRMGFWDNTRRRPGEEFDVPDEFAARSTWFHRADGPSPDEVVANRPVTAPGNANAHHVPGSEADERRKRPASSARRGKNAPAADDGETDEPADAGDEGTGAITPKGGKGKGSGDKRVI